MTLEQFVANFSSKRISTEVEKAAASADIVIAVYTGHAVFLEGAIEHGIDLYDNDDNDIPEDMFPDEYDDYQKKRSTRFKGTIFYFDRIGFLNPFSHHKSLEKWEEFLKAANKQYSKMIYNDSDDHFNCNFSYLPFNYISGILGVSQAIVFQVPKYDGIYLGKHRIPSYKDGEERERNIRSEYQESQKEPNYSNYWACDACGGDQDTGCLSSTECFRT